MSTMTTPAPTRDRSATGDGSTATTDGWIVQSTPRVRAEQPSGMGRHAASAAPVSYPAPARPRSPEHLRRPVPPHNHPQSPVHKPRGIEPPSGFGPPLRLVAARSRARNRRGVASGPDRVVLTERALLLILLTFAVMAVSIVAIGVQSFFGVSNAPLGLGEQLGMTAGVQTLK